MPTVTNDTPEKKRAADRLSSLKNHLTSTTMSQRPFITCHVLDTITGKPGANISVKLKLVSPFHAATVRWTATTNSDGRVPAWTSSVDINEVVKSVKAELADGEQMVWSLTFDTEAYFGRGNTFWPEVELRFAAKREEEHYHVPLLLGPWSYTTYRGS
ncbi:hypothetical protein M409DRAFT_65408 [Zasmidium cellare ATCC 36951]|uniref:5-hydroxyisourate hydrolase n=1 Tax=Zasmidium cellare ATCC 36951 TaxID=1080233 RepID=A0A6A6CRF0_ZASCE|nr:uncharacterized protein M409DRAFT_65408 [Zasmidium cellare ATCC 36951]KAF2168402.1 hypothetical protein M409DRAFT_65408 [Zasmidium cellare ATCC 36951]